MHVFSMMPPHPLPSSLTPIPRTFALFLLYDLSWMMVAIVYRMFIFYRFVDSGTPLMERLLLRSVGHSVILGTATSFSGWCHHQLVEGLGVEQNRATVVWALGGMLLTLAGRLTQSSASSVAQAIAFEVFATGAEISNIERLLKGQTPLKGLKNMLTCSKPPVTPSRRDENRVVFCSDAVSGGDQRGRSA